MSLISKSARVLANHGIDKGLLVFGTRIRFDVYRYVEGFSRCPVLTHRLRLNYFPFGLVLGIESESRDLQQTKDQSSSGQG
jgi:hypothetical protein